jgi:pimeloyl-ACP methyl ester carboxylesterase
MRAQEMLIPDDLAALAADTAFQEAYESMVRLDLSAVQRERPELQYPTSEAPAGYGVFIPRGELEDEHEAVVSFFPIANDLGDNMTIRHRFLQNSLAGASQVIAFPHNTHQEPNIYSLSSGDRYRIEGGSMKPLVDRQLKTLEHLGIERVRVIGDSVGSAIGAQFMRRAGETGAMEVGPSVLFEPVNVLQRFVKNLEANTRNGGLVPFLNAVNESGIPVYSKVQRTRGGLDYPALGKMLLWDFSRNAHLPDNKALTQGLTNDSFGQEAAQALAHNPALDLVVGRGDRSLMFPRVAATAVADQLQMFAPDRFRMYSAADRGHEMTNHLPTFVLVARAALQGQGALLPQYY